MATMLYELFQEKCKKSENDYNNMTQKKKSNLVLNTQLTYYAIFTSMTQKSSIQKKCLIYSEMNIKDRKEKKRDDNRVKKN